MTTIGPVQRSTVPLRSHLSAQLAAVSSICSTKHPFLGLALLGCLLAGFGCAETHAPQAGGDGVSHWLSSCDADSDCGALDCLCGVCTRQCTEAAACHSLDVAAVCNRTRGTTCPGPGDPTVCLPAETSPAPDAGMPDARSALDAGPCQPMDARHQGCLSGNVIGYAFTGAVCEAVLCACDGADCGRLYDSAEDCLADYGRCVDSPDDPCAAQRASSDPTLDCDGWSGYVWNGSGCEGVCGCEGPDCDAQYGTRAQCERARLSCALGNEDPPCDQHADCVLHTTDCCACFEAGPDDVIALHASEEGAFGEHLCRGFDNPCPDCRGGEKWPTLYPMCDEGGNCAVLDVTPHATCETDADCRLTVKACCECGADGSADGWVAVSDLAAYRAMMCPPDWGCPECEGPTPPAGLSARCDSLEQRCVVHVDGEPSPRVDCPGLRPEAFEPAAEPGATGRGGEGLDVLRAEAKQSLETFRELAGSQGQDYLYRRDFASWTGSGCTTEIEVRDGSVVRRRQTRSNPDGVTEEWVELGDELGSHTGCHPVQTFEEVYATCLDEVLCLDPADNWIFLELSEDGLLQTCEYFPKGCADDCAGGPRITAFEWL